jgi:hypothetical protein
MPRCARLAHAVIALAIAFAPVTTRAAWGPDLVVDLGYSGQTGSTSARVLVDPAGDLIFVRLVLSNTPTTDITRVTRDGANLWERGLPAALDAVGRDGAGGITAVGSRTAVGTSGTDIAAARVASDGVFAPQAAPGFWWVAQKTGSDQLPRVDIDPAGGAYVAWLSDNAQLYLQRITTSGTPALGWSPVGRRLANPAGGLDSVAPGVVEDGAGGALVLFQSDRARVMRVRADTTNAPGWPAAGIALGSSPASWDYGASPVLSLIPSTPGHYFGLWMEGEQWLTTVADRIVVSRFDVNGVLDWGGELELQSGISAVSNLAALPDGAGGLLVTWMQSGDFMVTSLTPDGGPVAGPFAALSAQSKPGVIVPGRNGGFIVFHADASGTWGDWYTANGALDASEPVNPRLVIPFEAGHPTYPLTGASDGDGGAYLAYDRDDAPFVHTAYAQHVFRSGVLGVGTPPRLPSLSLAVSPNPAHGEVTLDLTLAGDAPARLELLDLAGRRVATRVILGVGGARRERFALPASLESGVYIVRLSQGGAVRVRRFSALR